MPNPNLNLKMKIKPQAQKNSKLKKNYILFILTKKQSNFAF